MKLEELTTKIYEDGVARAKAQEEELLGKAREESDRILVEARRKASEIVEAANSEAERARVHLASELKLAGEQALIQLKSRITDCLVENTLPAAVKESLSDKEFVQRLIQEIVAKWNVGDTNVDIGVILPSESQDAVAKRFAANAKELLDRGLEVKFTDDIKTGFQIRPKDGSYRISFQEQDFTSFFENFLRQRTRDVLFPSETGAAGASDGKQAGHGR
ncbi:MAG TPA: hypothetical protein VMW87_02220 [Spirochaetia bacterium]|nr:hypothetical protein [Spirochaetia bacterium]